MRIDDGCRPDPCWVAPGYGARTGAAGAENAFRTLLIPGVLLWCLEALGEWRGLIVDQVRLDLLVLGEKRLQVNHEIFVVNDLPSEQV